MPKVTFKPCFNFQQCEFEVEINSKEDLKKAEELFKDLLDMEMRVAPEQSNRSERNSSVNREPKATERQREIMRTYGIKFDSNTTQKEASELINKSMNNSH